MSELVYTDVNVRGFGLRSDGAEKERYRIEYRHGEIRVLYAPAFKRDEHDNPEALGESILAFMEKGE